MPWTYYGQARPPFADRVGAGQESVWDYPRPPRIEADDRRVIVRVGDAVIADTISALRVLETASPPQFYIPPADVRDDCLHWGHAQSYCEWKGAAAYCDVAVPGLRVPRAGWRYAKPTAAFVALANHVAFYPAKLECFVAGERVRPQPGQFYGGWMTTEIVGPVKGEPGTEHW